MKTDCELEKKEGQSTSVTAFKYASLLTAAAPVGASQWASTFNMVAMYYNRGMWLLAPVLAGSVLAVSHQTIEILAFKYPENTFLQDLKNKSFFLYHGVGGAWADFGFAWSELQTLGIFIGGMDYATNGFGKYVAPALSMGPSVYSRVAQYKKAKGELESRSVGRHALSFFQASLTPTGPLGVLAQQDIISPDSSIPTVVMAGTGFIGLTASLVQESMPKLSLALNALLECAFNNPSLASAFFHFPLDMYAAEHNDEISDAFFFTIVGLTAIFLLMMTINSGLEFYDRYQNIGKEVEPQVTEIDDSSMEQVPINDDVEKYSSINVYPTFY